MITEIFEPEEGYVISNGFKMHYLEWGRSGKMIVALHSMRLDAHAFDFISKSMSREYRVLAIDQLGHGDSAKSVTEVPLEQHMEIIRGVVKERNFSDLILIGHSLGGFITMIYASKYPREVSKMILVDIAPRDPLEQRARRGERPIIPEHFNSKEEAVKYFKNAYPKYSQETVENRVNYALYISSNGKLRWKANMKTLNMLRETWNGFNFWPYVKKIEAPILLIKGGESQSVSIETVERMKNTLKDFSIVEVEGAGHQILLDRPKEFENAVRNFIQ